MTQRIFDVENEKDMQDLWDILPDDIEKIEVEEANGYNRFCYKKVGACEHSISSLKLIAINWHDKTEITRPIQEATEQDIGKLCYFWGNDKNDYAYGILRSIGTEKGEKYYTIDDADGGLYFEHARRLTRQEIEELC